jgi:hypothetical protein
VAKDHEVARVIFQVIEDGDRRKFEAVSNDADTGGGARDLRFRPANRFLPVFGRMFPGRTIRRRTREGVQVELELLNGTFVTPQATDEAERASRDITVWPETNARPGECRIAQVNRYDFLPLLPPQGEGGQCIMMLIQTYGGTVNVWFTSEAILRHEVGWDESVKRFALRWLDTDAKSAFLDLERGEEFPDV